MKIIITLLCILIAIQITLFCYVVYSNSGTNNKLKEISSNYDSINNTLNMWELTE